MTDKIVILVTCGNRRQAKKIAHHLVEGKLAACVTRTQQVESIYRWKGKVQDDKEFLLIIKTRSDLFPKVEAAVRALHSYTTPEIIALPIVAGSQDYLAWLGSCL